MAQHNSFKTILSFFFEAEIGDVPADGPAWATAEGTDAFRHFVLEADPAFIVGDALLANVDLQPEVFAVGNHHHGLPTADGGSIKMRLVGAGGSWADDTQVTETAQGRLVQHALGGGARGHHTTVASAVSNVSFTLDSGDNLEPGYIIGIEDADDLGRIYPVQVLTVTGAAITVDTSLPFTIAPGDKVYGAEHAWPDAEALTNPSDAAYSTLSILYQKGPHCWMVGGAHLELQAVELERGMQPRLGFAVLGARGYPQDAGAPAAPAWSGSIQGGADTLAIGRDTKLLVQTKGTTTWASLCVFSASFSAGVPIKPTDGVTEAHDGAPGRCGYATEPADTVLEVVVGLESGHQAWWSAGTLLNVRYYQVAPVGRGYAITMHEATLMGPPEPQFEQTNRYKLKFQAREDLESSDDPALAAKFVIARF
jgi:hypothetical protein